MSTKHLKYTKELLEEAVANSISYAGVLRHLGLRQAGGTQAHITRRIRDFKIDTSHFLGQSSNLGKIDSKRKTPEQILILLPEGSKRPKRPQVLRALLELGVDYACSSCYNGGSWNGKDLVLEIDHINGNWLDNRFENLRFMCPNCHSQEPTSRSWKFTRT